MRTQQPSQRLFFFSLVRSVRSTTYAFLFSFQIAEREKECIARSIVTVVSHDEDDLVRPVDASFDIGRTSRDGGIQDVHVVDDAYGYDGMVRFSE